ncbi:MAG: phosphoglucosamine mutase [Pseudomonadales bacterium]|nr:phosphoglucosamine mutase [Pseudomonadales bacterium]
MSKKYFGTDGIRGEVGLGSITPEFMLRLGWAAGKVFSGGNNSKVLIGKDTRISGYMFESALEAGLSSAGVDVCLLGPMPTPGIAYLTRTFHAQAGIVISASHNAFQDNGIKFFSGQGEKLDDETEHQIEAQMALSETQMTVVNSSDLGKAYRITDAAGRYIEFCKSTIPSIDLSDMTVVLDCANGATYHIAPNVFKELGATVISLGIEPDGLNINRDAGSTNPENLAKKVLEVGADIGIAFDGDGDRVVMVDHTGRVVDGDEILYVIAADQKQSGRLKGGVVGTLMSNLGMEQALARLDIPFSRANVGDRYVMADLASQGWSLGGESSGHIICLDATTTGDGIVSALQVVSAMILDGKTLAELTCDIRKLPQLMINVRIGAEVNAKTLCESELLVSEVARIDREFNGKGRVLLRPSGTEPLIRVMVEGEDTALVNAYAEELAETVRTALS